MYEGSDIMESSVINNIFTLGEIDETDKFKMVEIIGQIAVCGGIR